MKERSPSRSGLARRLPALARLGCLGALGATGLWGAFSNPGQAAPADPAYCFAPEQDCAAMAATAVLRAVSSIRVEAYVFTDRRLAQALLRQVRLGRRVKLIVDRGNECSPFSLVPELMAAGVEVAVDRAVALQHNKVIVIDDRLVLFGSMNWSSAAAHGRNAENLVLLDDPRAVAAFGDQWARMDRIATPFVRRSPADASCKEEHPDD